MTAEIAVMNKHAVALAADSAATVSGSKVLSANKIFALSKYEPVGIMVYGHAACMEVPWEVIIKTYREDLGTRSFASLDSYARDFFRYLGRSDFLFPRAAQEHFAWVSAATQFLELRTSISKQVDDEAQSGPVSEKRSRQITRQIVDAAHQRFGGAAIRPNLPKGYRAQLDSTYGKQIDKARRDVFQKLHLTPKTRQQLREIALSIWTRGPFSGESGVVIAGYGRKDLFPSVSAREADGVLLNHTLEWPHSHASVTRTNRAALIGYAQGDVIYLFMEGVIDSYQRYVEDYFEEMVDVLAGAFGAGAPDAKTRAAVRKAKDALLTRFERDLHGFRRRTYVEPILRVIGSLPKDELSAVAESLVNLTSLKRRISMDQETVGGPIDVAVISRSEGLIWTRRKHYFESELNPQFFANYFRRRPTNA